MRKIVRVILILLLVALVAIQFIRPPKNVSEGIAENDMSTVYTIPDSVRSLLKVACYDCHSNNTRYPWYWQIQPVMWFMNGHIKEGKRHLNFSIFTSYRIGKQYKMFDNINKEVKKGDMPLTSYTLIHRDAVLNETEKLAITNWTTILRKEIEDHYPKDSLKTDERKRPM